MARSSPCSSAAAGQGRSSGRPRSTATPRSSLTAGLTISTMPVGPSAMTPSSSRLSTADNPPRSRSTTAKATARRSRISSMTAGEAADLVGERGPGRGCRNRPVAIVAAAPASLRTRRVTRLATARLTTTASVTASKAPSTSLRRSASLVRAARPVRGAYATSAARPPVAVRTGRAMTCELRWRFSSGTKPTPSSRTKLEDVRRIGRSAQLQAWAGPRWQSAATIRIEERERELPVAGCAGAACPPSLSAIGAVLTIVRGVCCEAESRILGERAELVVGCRYDIEGRSPRR